MSDPADLRNSGLKVTLPRLKVLALFEGSQERHLGADDIYRMLLAHGEDVGIATVYRVLTQFEQAGILVRHHFESDKAVYELNQGGHHDHIVCLSCGHVEEFCDPEIEKRQKQAASRRGFKIRSHALHIYGDCTRDPCPHKT